MVMSHAYHEPDKLDQLLRAPVEEALNEAVKDSNAWESDDWWKASQSGVRD